MPCWYHHWYHAANGHDPAPERRRGEGAAAPRGARGPLEAALARPRASAFGEDAYPTIHDKAGALLHSIARNHALVDGNKRLALAAVIAYYGMNGLRLTLSDEDAYLLVMDVACGDRDDVPFIAATLKNSTIARR